MKEIPQPAEWSEYKKNDNQPYCDKGGHKERSIFHNPQHKDHWKKEERKNERPDCRYH